MYSDSYVCSVGIVLRSGTKFQTLNIQTKKNTISGNKER